MPDSLYSSECVEGEFCEVPLYGTLRSSSLSQGALVDAFASFDITQGTPTGWRFQASRL